MHLIGRASEAISSPVSSRARLLTSLIGLTLAVTLLLTCSTMGRGANQRLSALEHAFGENMIVVRASRAGTPLTLSLATDLSQQVPEVTRILGVTEQITTAVRPGRGSARVLLVGADERLPEIKGWQMAEGRSLVTDDITQSRKVAVLGQVAAQNLFPVRDGKTDARLGAEVLVNNLPFTVVGVFRETPLAARDGLSDVNDCIIIPVSASLTLSGSGQLSLLAAQARGKQELPVAVGHLQRVLDARARGAYALTTFAGEFNTTYAATRVFVRALGGAALLALICGIGGLWLMLRAAVRERSAEISIRLAAGATRRSLLVEFLSEGVMLGLVAGGIGILVGLALTLAIRNRVGWPISVGLGTIPGCLLLAMAGGGLAGLEPAISASRVDPVALWE